MSTTRRTTPSGRLLRKTRPLAPPPQTIVSRPAPRSAAHPAPPPRRAVWEVVEEDQALAPTAPDDRLAARLALRCKPGRPVRELLLDGGSEGVRLGHGPRCRGGGGGGGLRRG